MSQPETFFIATYVNLHTEEMQTSIFKTDREAEEFLCIMICNDWICLHRAEGFEDVEPEEADLTTLCAMYGKGMLGTKFIARITQQTGNIHVPMDYNS